MLFDVFVVVVVSFVMYFFKKYENGPILLIGIPRTYTHNEIRYRELIEPDMLEAYRELSSEPPRPQHIGMAKMLLATAWMLMNEFDGDDAEVKGANVLRNQSTSYQAQEKRRKWTRTMCSPDSHVLSPCTG